MGSFMLHPAAYAVVVATTLASIPVAAVEVSGSASRSATVCTVEVTALPVSKARLLPFGNYRGPPASHNVEAQRFLDQVDAIQLLQDGAHAHRVYELHRSGVARSCSASPED
mgnify:CR=1 FL=1